MRKVVTLAILALVLFSEIAFAEISIGAGLSSATAGRLVPGLYGAYEGDSWAISGMSTGVSTELYYHSAYQLGVFFEVWKPGDFWWGELNAGVGGAIYYAKKGYKPSDDEPLHEQDDFSVGPSLRVAWQFAGPGFIAIDAMFGIGGISFVLLAPQDITTLALGVRF